MLKLNLFQRLHTPFAARCRACLPPLVNPEHPGRRWSQSNRPAFFVPACNTFTSATRPASANPRISFPVSNFPGYPPDAITTQALAPDFHFIFSGLQGFQPPASVSTSARSKSTRARIACVSGSPQPAVELQHLWSALRATSIPRTEILVANPVRGQSLHRWLHDRFFNRSPQSPRAKVRPKNTRHAACVRPFVLVEGPLCDPASAPAVRIAPIRQQNKRKLLALQSFPPASRAFRNRPAHSSPSHAQ